MSRLSDNMIMDGFEEYPDGTIGTGMSSVKTAKEKVKNLLTCAYCYEMDGTFRICDFPGRDGQDIGTGKTELAAWKAAAKRYGL